MDYKYIEQLLERYWMAETTLEEENVLRAFFSQKDIPAELSRYSSLFTYEAAEAASSALGDDFDARMLAMTEEQPQAVTARVVTLRQRLMPLFKAAAVVAIILTLGNAAQKPWDASWNDPRIDYANTYSVQIDSADVIPVQAENISDVAVDSTKAIQAILPKD